MYAIIQTGGKQYRVTEGEVIRVEKLAGEPGEQISFDQVLFVGDSETPAVGVPTVPEARVVGTVVEHGKGDKVLVFKFKRRKMFRRLNGHRQTYTGVRIEQIDLGGSKKSKKKDDSAETTEG